MTGLALSPRRVARNTASRGAGTLLAQAGKAVAALLVARRLGPEALGVFSVVLVTVSALARCATLGVDTLLVRELNRVRPLIAVRTAMALAAGGALLAAALCLVGPSLVGAGDDVVQAFAAGALFVLLTPPVLVLGASFNGRERMDLEAWPLVVEGVLAVVAVAAVLASGAGVPGALLALGLARLANLACSVVLHRRLPAQQPATSAPIPEVLRHSGPMWGSSIVSALLQRIDVLVLALLVGPEQVGLYVAASTVVLVLADLGMHYTYALFPVLSRATGSCDADLLSMLRTVTRRLMTWLTAVAAVLVLTAEPVVTLVYGRDFADSAPLLVLLAVLLPLRVVASLWGLALTATGQQVRRFALALVALAASATAVTVLAAARSAAGAAVAVVLVEVLVLVLLHRGLRAPNAAAASG